jgi:hypothetical protein
MIADRPAGGDAASSWCAGREKRLLSRFKYNLENWLFQADYRVDNEPRMVPVADKGKRGVPYVHGENL